MRHCGCNFAIQSISLVAELVRRTFESERRRGSGIADSNRAQAAKIDNDEPTCNISRLRRCAQHRTVSGSACYRREADAEKAIRILNSKKIIQ